MSILHALPRQGWPSLIVVIFAVAAKVAWSAEPAHVFYHEHQLGTSLELKVVAPSQAVARRAESVVLDEITRLSGALSRYDRQSEFSRWSRGEAAGPISADLRSVLLSCDRWRARSGGVFNPGVAAFAELWNAGQQVHLAPKGEDLERLAPEVSQPAWSWDAGNTTATRTGSLPLTLDALAKGYVIDRCCDAVHVQTPEVSGLMLKIGGDLRICGNLIELVEVANPRQTAENAPPLAHVKLQKTALATSGGYRRGWTIGGQRYSHILDPRSGRPVDPIRSATVIAATTEDADALATILCVLSPQQGLRLVADLPDVECLLVGEQGKIYRSAGWREEWQLAQAVASPAKSSGGLDGFELEIRFELSQPDAARYHRPYVAVWVEDAQGFPLRTLVLWVKTTGSGPTWAPDLKRWFRGDLKRLEVDRRDFLATRSSATRPPGKYDIVWDGLDNLGKPAPPGTYTVRLEAAREHGTYQMIRKEVELGAAPFKLALPGGVEIKSAALDYRRRPPADVRTQ